MNKISLFIAMIFLATAFTVMDTTIFEVPEHWPKPHYDFIKNPLTSERIELGKALFYDPILSRNNTISCTSCHSQYSAFTHADHALSHGIEDRIGTRNSPALMNLAWQTSFMWDGAINHLDMQSLFPITHPKEMDETIEHVITKLKQSKIYTTLFYKAFGDSSITGERTLKSISQFVLTLVSANSKYDSVMRGQTAFTQQQQNGYKLFKRNCASCHAEPLFTNYQFENNGLPLDTTLTDFGRMNITKNPLDSLKFKVPTLRNIEFSYPYMHDGRFKRLSDVIRHYTSGIQFSRTLSKKLQKPIVFSSNDKVDLISFLLTLSDKTYIFNPNYTYPRYIFFPKPKD